MQLDQHMPLAAEPLHGIAQDIGASKRHRDTVAESREPHSPVRDIMTKSVVTFGQDTPIEVATLEMLRCQISGAPVVDEAGKPVGIVSKTDLLEAWFEHHKAKCRGEAAEDAEAPIGVVVGDIMVPYLLAAQDSSPISLAAALMAYEGVHRLLVLDDDQQMVGIVSTLDVLRWLAQLSGFCLPSPA